MILCKNITEGFFWIIPFGVSTRWMVLKESFRSTLPETNIFAPEDEWLEDEILFEMTYFQGLLLLVSGVVISN